MDDSHDPEQVRTSYWSAQPGWVRFLTVIIALPAWLALVWLILTQNFDEQYIKMIVGAIVVVAIVQTYFVARAYLRLDL